MQRDKRGRFVKKAQDGSIITLNNNKYKVLDGAMDAFALADNYGEDEFMLWLLQEGSDYYEAVDPSVGMTTRGGKRQKKTSTTNTNQNGLKQLMPRNSSYTQQANGLELIKAGIAGKVNNDIVKEALKAEKPFLQDSVEHERTVLGNYNAVIQGQQAAAKLTNLASMPISSDGALQSQMQMEAAIKGQEYINQGKMTDDSVIRQAREVKWEQDKENAINRASVAAQNDQAMLMTQKNKANIINSGKSANYSQVIQPLLEGTEKRLRDKGAKQEYYRDQYENAAVASNVWGSYRDELSDNQKALADAYMTGGVDKVDEMIEANPKLKTEWDSLYNIMNNEIIRQQAGLRGINLQMPNYSTVAGNTTQQWTSAPMNWGFRKKQGGTIYKAKLTARTKTNDRTSKSIEASRKIASRFLEKAIDSLYTYKDVELIAKPKNKRKYQAGGGLPFVGFTPVFATSEIGAPKEAVASTTKKSDKNDLTTKDILELLKDLNGLPSDIDAIQAELVNFSLRDNRDPLGLSSTSSIASRYLKIIGKIQKAKINRDWYDKAYNTLREKGALNEYAIDSTGHFLGMNSTGDFARFTPKQVIDGELSDYQLLTNSNLLDIRARYPNAAFNSNLIMEAANGVSMNQVTEHINKVIQGLGSDKNTTQVFGDQSKEVLEGLRQIQHAAQQVGQDLSISQLYEAEVFTESQARQADLALDYLYQTMPTNMQALLVAKARSIEGARNLIKTLVDSKLKSTTKLEFSPKNTRQGTSGSKSGNASIAGLKLSPAQMLQQGFGERERIIIQDASSTGISVDAITMPITTDSNKPLGAATLEDIATSQFGGLLNFAKASMGGNTIPFEGRKNIAVDGSKIYSMYLPIDQDEIAKGNIVPDIALIDRVNAVNKKIKELQITDYNEINNMYVEAGLPVYLNDNGTVVPTSYMRFGVLNGTAIDNAFGKEFVESRYLKEIDDEDIISGAIAIMNQGRSKEDRIEYDAKSFFNFGGLLGDYDSVYQGTIFIPMSNDVFLGIAGSGNTITATEANMLEAQQQQHNRVNATYKNPGQLR